MTNRRYLITLPQHQSMAEQKDLEKEIGDVGPTFEDAIEYAFKDGAIDLYRLQKLEGRYGYNGGRGCDVLSGPCSCGAWH